MQNIYSYVRNPDDNYQVFHFEIKTSNAFDTLTSLQTVWNRTISQTEKSQIAIEAQNIYQGYRNKLGLFFRMIYSIGALFKENTWSKIHRIYFQIHQQTMQPVISLEGIHAETTEERGFWTNITSFFIHFPDLDSIQIENRSEQSIGRDFLLALAKNEKPENFEEILLQKKEGLALLNQIYQKKEIEIGNQNAIQEGIDLYNEFPNSFSFIDKELIELIQASQQSGILNRTFILDGERLELDLYSLGALIKNSSYFRQLIFSEFQEARNPELRFEFSKPVFLVYLNCLASDNFDEITPDNLLELYELADYTNNEIVKKLCSDYIHDHAFSNYSIDEILNLHKQSHNIDFRDLSDKCEEFISNRLRSSVNNGYFNCFIDLCEKLHDRPVNMLNFTNSAISDEHLQYLENIPELYGLTLGWKWGSYGEESVNNLTECGLERLKNFNSLTHLDLSRIRSDLINENTLKHITALENLTSLHLKAKKCVDRHLAEIASKLPKLKTIGLKSGKISYQGLIHLTKLENLETLDLSNSEVDFYGDSFIEKLDFKRLGTLILRRSSDIEDRYIGFDNFKRVPTLTSLDVSSCRLSTYNLAKKFPNLISLNLDKNEYITDENLSHLKKLKHLQTLSLESCRNISEEGLKHLSHLENLSVLKLRFCSNVSVDSLIQLKDLKKLTHLDILEIEYPLEDLLRILNTLESLKRITVTSSNIEGATYQAKALKERVKTKIADQTIIFGALRSAV